MSNSLPADMLTATDQIYLSLWNQICSLDLLPGEKLSEVRLAAEFECSRVPVREALHRLAADGAVDVFPKRGSFVSLIDRQQVEQTRYLREVLETHVCLEAFDSGALTAIYPYLCSIVEQQRTARAMDDIATVFRLDEDFHHIFYSLISTISSIRWPTGSSCWSIPVHRMYIIAGHVCSPSIMRQKKRSLSSTRIFWKRSAPTTVSACKMRSLPT